ncbi:hypothetical protein Acr_00g0012060 [Actinidia rufa]|uniref:Uncharacterized protein n=1 Tax=Actinidia rufa TaxID=165716 RepID=A0A7J0D9N0_9ERIC|nr:hypothetical protein Acr_00g0012060 [Actinidia rufa]
MLATSLAFSRSRGLSCHRLGPIDIHQATSAFRVYLLKSHCLPCYWQLCHALTRYSMARLVEHVDELSPEEPVHSALVFRASLLGHPCTATACQLTLRQWWILCLRDYHEGLSG